MTRLVAKYHSIYLFIVTLSLIGFITGYFYYKVQEDNVKVEIVESINIQETLNGGFNNIFKRFKEYFYLFGSSFLIIFVFSNTFKCFTIPFEIGFLFSLLSIYKWKFSIIYMGIYYIIPFLFMLVLVRISVSLSINVVKYLIFRDSKVLRYIKVQCLKYLIIVFMAIFYEFIISIFSYNINLYLMTFIG